MRTCKKCGATKPLDQFSLAAGRRRHECRDCYSARHKRYYVNRPKGYRERSRKAYYAKRRDWLKTPEGVIWRRAQNRTWNNANRQIVLNHYGARCACCGEGIERFLTVDHKHNDGNERRAIHGTGSAFYRHIIKNGFPSEFQILCFNCNLGRAMNGGTCPHKEGSTTRARARRAKRPEAPGPQTG